MKTLLMLLLAATFTNPILYADYSDPDVTRHGDKFYMTSSSFNCSPGLQIMESEDLVHWQIVDAALPYAIPGGTDIEDVEHGNQVWAPSIREHNGLLYIYYGDPDVGIYCIRGTIGNWEKPVLVMAGKGLIDSCPLWDEDGRCYLSYALAGSRAGNKSVVLVAELEADGLSVKRPGRIVFDGHKNHPTCEGTKLYKHNGFYYIMLPAGGVPTGWQLTLRSKSIYGPYEAHVSMSQGTTKINGPHQGAWVETQTGENWFFHFQDVGALGRIVHLQPMSWVNDWPVIGAPQKGNPLCGEPVAKPAMPNVGRKTKLLSTYNTLDGSDNFASNELGLQWQWQREPLPQWYYLHQARTYTDENKNEHDSENYLRLYSVKQCLAEKGQNLWHQPNCLLQKTASLNPSMTVKVSFEPTTKYLGERAGLVLMGMDYAAIVMENTADGIVLKQVMNIKADRKFEAEKQTIGPKIEAGQTIFLKVNIESKEPAKIPTFNPGMSDQDAKKIEGSADMKVTAIFYYSLDGKTYKSLGEPFAVKEGKWIGAKFGLFCSRPDVKTNDGGWMNVYNVSVR